MENVHVFFFLSSSVYIYLPLSEETLEVLFFLFRKMKEAGGVFSENE